MRVELAKLKRKLIFSGIVAGIIMLFMLPEILGLELSHGTHIGIALFQLALNCKWSWISLRVLRKKRTRNHIM